MPRRALWSVFFLLGLGLTDCVPVSISADAAVTLDGPSVAVLDAGTGDAQTSPRPDAGPVVDPGPQRAYFVLPRAGETPGAYALPWPSDVLRTADGHVDFSRFPQQTIPLIATYVRTANAALRGWGTQSAIYARFSAPIDPASLPQTLEASRQPTSSVQLIDVDQASPERGTRVPLVFHWQPTASRFYEANTLAARPVFGRPLRGGRQYALVVTTDVRGALGTLTRDADLEALLGTGGDAAVQAARTLHAPALEALDAAGILRERILSLAVFTTQEPTEELFRVRDWLYANQPVPTAVDSRWRVNAMNSDYTEYQGAYGPSPIFQEGVIPYTEDGGAIRFDAQGDPIVQGSFEARFALTVPRTPPPPGGYPIALYAHGTGGDWRSFISNGDGTARRLAQQGWAVMGVDQIHHGARNPTTVDPSLLFFNFSNPTAGRDNNRQSAIDVVSQARFARAMTVPASVVPGGGAAITFDASKVAFFGHSQGGTNGPLFLAADDSVIGGVLSGAGATISITLLEKTEPVSIPQLVGSLLGITNFGREGFTPEHPACTLVQSLLEVEDPANYGRFFFATPRPGFAPKHILQTEGMLDLYVPPSSIESLAASASIPLLNPVTRAVPALELQGLTVGMRPVSENAGPPGRRVTAGLVQYPNDGHFAVFDNAGAQRTVNRFFVTLAAGAPAIE